MSDVCANRFRASCRRCIQLAAVDVGGVGGRPVDDQIGVAGLAAADRRQPRPKPQMIGDPVVGAVAESNSELIVLTFAAIPLIHLAREVAAAQITVESPAAFLGLVVVERVLQIDDAGIVVVQVDRLVGIREGCAGTGESAIGWTCD